MSRDLFILCGEHSGDLQGARLLQALQKMAPDTRCFGVPGPRLRALGVEPVIPMEEFQMMGIVEVLRSLKKLRRQVGKLIDAIDKRRPGAVLLIDYPGLNLRVAKKLRKRGFEGQIIQYISPKVWAWRKRRIYPLARALDLMLVIFPFEPQCYSNTSLRVEYIGNPLAELVAESLQQGVACEGSLVGLFPGSRRSEIKLLLPRILKTVKQLLSADPSLAFVLSVANTQIEPLILRCLAELEAPVRARISLAGPGETYALMRRCRAALATSGTVNLELALHGVPSVVVYRLTWLNAALARLIFRLNLPHYCMVNIVAGATVYPELMQHKFTPKRAAFAVRQLVSEGADRERCLQGCRAVSDLLSEARASERGASLIRQALAASDR